MKIKKVLSVVKNNVEISLFQAGGRTVISCGAAAYDISPFPYIESTEELAKVLGIDKPEDYVFKLHEHMLPLMEEKPDVQAEVCFTEVRSGNLDLSVFFDGNKAYMVNSKYLKPFDDEDMYYIKKNSENAYIMVGGLSINGVVMPIKPAETMIGDLDRIVRGVRI